jgi:Mg/Co/Ni transporter MgtE
VLPVVDSAGVLIGIVTADDIFDVLEEEVTEDIHRTASVAAAAPELPAREHTGPVRQARSAGSRYCCW